MPREDEIERAVVGLGNPFHGDDAIGLVVAQAVHRTLESYESVHLLETPNSGFALAETLVGYRRALIIDSLIDSDLDVGIVKRMGVAECHSEALLSPHTGGFREGLALGRAAGLQMPAEIVIYGIVIRQPQCFTEGLSGELQSRLPAIVALIAEASRSLQIDEIEAQTRDEYHSES